MACFAERRSFQRLCTEIIPLNLSLMASSCKAINKMGWYCNLKKLSSQKQHCYYWTKLNSFNTKNVQEHKALPVIPKNWICHHPCYGMLLQSPVRPLKFYFKCSRSTISVSIRNKSILATDYSKHYHFVNLNGNFPQRTLSKGVLSLARNVQYLTLGRYVKGPCKTLFTFRRCAATYYFC